MTETNLAMRREPPRVLADPDVQASANLTVAYIVALSIVAILSILGQWLVQRSLQSHRNDSTVVNIAGRQRMLSQRLTKAALAWERDMKGTEQTGYLDEFADTLALWQKSHDGLQNGDPAMSLPGDNSELVRQKFAEIEPAFREIENAAKELLSILRDGRSDISPTVASETTLDELAKREATPSEIRQQRVQHLIARILASEPRFLEAMDRLVFQLDVDARQRVERLQRVESGLLALTLMVLLIEAILIFRPAVQRIRLASTALRKSQQEMAIAKEAAEAANAAKSRFLSNISHELRNPLHVVLGHVELLKQERHPAERVKQLKHIDVAARSLLELVDDLLDLGMLERGQVRVDLQEVDLNQLITQTWTMLEVEARRQGIDYRLQMDERLSITARLDPRRVRQILLNLLGNALKFTAKGMVVLASEKVEQSGQAWWRCRVIDTGAGVAVEHRERIFEPFTQADESVGRRHGGAGLGLAICKQLAEQMGGNVALESSSTRGSTFVLLLPIHEVETPPRMPGNPRSESQIHCRQLKLLVVDDDPVNTQLLASMLEGLGHCVTTCHHASEITVLLEQKHFDAVLLDLQMPGVSGTEIARRLSEPNRRHVSMVARIGVTASPALAAEVREIPGLFDEVVTKPIDLTKLSEAIAAATKSSFDSMKVSTDDSIHFISGDNQNGSVSLGRFDGDKALAQNLIDKWVAHAPGSVAQLEAAISSDDLSTLERIAHLLRGQAATLGISRLQDAAQRLEEASHRCDFAMVKTLARSLVATTHEVLRDISPPHSRAMASVE